MIAGASACGESPLPAASKNRRSARFRAVRANIKTKCYFAKKKQTKNKQKNKKNKTKTTTKKKQTKKTPQNNYSWLA